MAHTVALPANGSTSASAEARTDAREIFDAVSALAKPVPMID
jgi:hypothetical protein